MSYLDSDFVLFDMLTNLLGVDKNKLQDSVGKLINLNLVELVPVEKSYFGLKLNSLVKNELDFYFTNNKSEALSDTVAKTQILAYLDELFPKIDSNLVDKRWLKADLIYNQVLKYVEDFYTSEKKEFNPDNYDKNALALISSVCYKLGAYNFFKLFNYKSAIKYLLVAIRVKQVLLNNEQSLELALMYNSLAICYEKVEDLRHAIEFNKLAYEIRLKLYNGDKNNEEIAHSISNLASCFFKLGDYKKALEYNKSVHEIRQVIDEGLTQEMADVLDTLGVNYEKLADFRTSLDHHMKSLEIRKKLFKLPHPDIAQSFNNIGVAYDKMGDFKNALENLEFSYKIRVDLAKNVQTHELANSLMNLATVNAKIGQHKKALDFFTQAYEIRNGLFKELAHPDLADALNSIGICHEKLGNPTKALFFLKQAFRIRKEVYMGGNHADIADSFTNMGIGYDKLGEKRLAHDYFVRAYKMRKDLCSENFVKNLNRIEMWPNKSVREWMIDCDMSVSIRGSLGNLKGSDLIHLYFLSIDNQQKLFEILHNLTKNRVSHAECLDFKARLETLFVSN